MTDYIDKINGYPVGGEAVGGEWLLKNASIVSDVSLSEDSTTYYTLSLPDDSYDYEIIGYVSFEGQATSGTHSNLVVSNTSGFSQSSGTDYARSNYTMMGNGSFRIPISASDRRLRVQIYNGNVTHAYIYWRWYRRIGLND